MSVASGVPVASARGPLTNRQMHDLFQNVGRGAVHPEAAYQVLSSGCHGCKQGAGKDERLHQALLKSRCSIHDVLRQLAITDADLRDRVAHAQRASGMLDKAQCQAMGRGHVWRFVLHGKCALDNSVRHRASWLTCMCRDVDDGGLSVHGDLERAVYSALKVPHSKEEALSSSMPPRPPPRTWLARHAEHVEASLATIERNRRARKAAAAWYLETYRDRWHDGVPEAVFARGESDSNSDSLSEICDSDDPSDRSWHGEDSDENSVAEEEGAHSGSEASGSGYASGAGWLASQEA